MVTERPQDPIQKALFDAVQVGDSVRVQSIVESVQGTGIFPPRLNLLEGTNSFGQRAEDLAKTLAQGSPMHQKIADYLSGQRLHMEYFE